MAPKYVGKVVLTAEVDASKVAEQLHDSLVDNVLPQIKKFNAEFGQVQQNIDAINSKSLDEIAKSAGIAEKRTGDLIKAEKALKREQAALNDLKAQSAKLSRDQGTAQRRVNKEIKETGKASKASQMALMEAQEANAASRELELEQIEMIQAATDKVTQYKTSAHETYLRQARTQRNVLIDAQRDTLRGEQQLTQDLINEYIERSKPMIAADKAVTRSLEIEQKKRERLAKKQAEDDIPDADKARDVTKSLTSKAKQGIRSTGAVFNIAGAGPGVLTAVAVAAVQALEVLVELSGVLGTLPGLFAAAGASMGTFMVATYGIEDAIKAVIDGDMDKIGEALAKLAPSAQQAVLSFQSLLPVFGEVRKAVQENFFAGFGEQLYRLTDTFLPMIDGAMRTLSTQMNTVIMSVTNQLMTPENVGVIDGIITNIVTGFKMLEPAVAPAVQAIIDLTRVSASFLPKVSAILVDIITRFSTWISDLANSGDLTKWIQKGLDTLLEFEPVLKSLFNLLATLGSGDSGFLGFLEGVINAMTWIIDNGKVIVTVIGLFTGLFAAVKVLVPLFTIMNVLSTKFAASLAAQAAAGAGAQAVMSKTSAAALSVVTQLNAIGPVAAQQSAKLAAAQAPAQAALARVTTGAGGTVAALKAMGPAAEAAAAQVAAAQAVNQAALAKTGASAVATSATLTGTGAASAAGAAGVATSQAGAQAAMTRTTALSVTTSAALKAQGAAAAAGAAQAVASQGLIQAALARTTAAAATVGTTLTGLGAAAATGVTGMITSLGRLLGPVGIIAVVGTALYGLYEVFKSINEESRKAIEATNEMRAQSERDRALYPSVPFNSGTLLDVLGGKAAPPTGLIPGAPAPTLPKSTQEALDGPLGNIILPGGIAADIDPAQAAIQAAGPTAPGYVAPTVPGYPDGGFAVPPPPAVGADGKPVKEMTDAEKRQAIANDPKYAIENYLDPTAVTDAINNAPGNPGQVPLRTEVTNMPKNALGGGISVNGGSLGAVPLPPPIPFSALPSVDGEKPQVTAMLRVAQAFGLSTAGVGNDFFGNYSHVDDGLNHPKGLAGDFATAGVQVPDDAKLAMANFLSKNFGDLLNELIYSDPRFSGGISMGRISNPDPNSQLAIDHRNHIHASISDANAPAFEARLNRILGQVNGAVPPTSLDDSLTAINQGYEIDQSTGELKLRQTDTEDIRIAQAAVDEAKLAKANAIRDRDLLLAYEQQGLLKDANELQEANNKITAENTDLLTAEAKLREAQRGKFSDVDSPKNKALNFDELPLGDPRKAMAAFIGGLGGGTQTIAAALGLLGEPVGGAFAAAGSTPMFNTGTAAADTTAATDLLKERNPAFIPAVAGYDVPDYSRQGGSEGIKDTEQQTAPPFLANGAITSNTAALADRTLTNSDAETKARLDQLLAVMEQVKTQLTAEVLGPVVEKSIAAGISEISIEVLQQLGQAIGEAAGPVVAQAVKEAIGEDGGSQQPTLPGKALGGPITGGTPGRDSVPALLMPGEFVLTTAEVQRMGGFAGVERFRAALARGSVQRFATGGGVGVRTGNPNGGQNANSTVGADFFGLSQIPVLAAAINALTQVLLAVIDVEIITRDSLVEVSKSMKDFRGDFKAFDASGRIKNDTSGLVDRTSSSEQQVANERIRILKLVLQGIIDFIIEKIIVPIGKALANAVISAVSQGVTGALGTFFPGSDILAGILSAALSATAEVFIQIAADVFTIAAELFFAIGLEAIGELLQTIFPQLTTTFFSGAGLEQIVGPISQGLIGLTGTLTVAFGNLVGLFSGIASVGPLIQNLLAGFTPLTATLSGLVGVLASIFQALSLLVDGLVTGVSGAFAPVISVLNSLLGGFVPIVSGLSMTTLNINSIVQALAALLGGFTSLGAGLFAPLTTSVSSTLSGFVPVISGLTTSVNGLQAVNLNIATLLSGFGSLVTGVTGMVSLVKLPSASVNPAAVAATAPVVNSVDNLVRVLSGSTGLNTTTINAPMTVIGQAEQAARTIQNRLLALI